MTSQIKLFTPDSGAREGHLIVLPDASLSLGQQLSEIAADVALAARDGLTPILMRCFLSDPANQIDAARRAFAAVGCPVSFIGQAPLDGAKAAAWVWLREGANVVAEPGNFGRVDLGDGANADLNAPVTMDSLSYIGLPAGSISYLKAASHLNPTSEYGVAFERATAVDFADRRHVYVSGTASIDNRGRILYPGDVIAQAGRMIENVDALLAEGGCSIADVGHFIVYLRDPADYAAVSRLFADRFYDIPTVIVHAPGCRPGCLIETECMAARCL